MRDAVTPCPPPPPGLGRRLRWAALLMGVSFATLGGRLGLFSARGDDVIVTPANAVDMRPVPRVRGRILDRNGTTLAGERDGQDIYMTPGLVGPMERQLLVEMLDLNQEEVATVDRGLARAGDAAWNRAVLLLEDQPPSRIQRLLAAGTLLEGAFQVHSSPRRTYPQGELAAHLVGYTSADGDGDPVGQRGVERAFERSLRGREGVASVPPLDVVLTIDLATQRVVEDGLRRHRTAAAAVVEIDTGRVLALASNPSFDPNLLSGPHARAELARLEEEDKWPLLDRTLERAYPPASTFKLVTAIAGLESGEATSDEEVTCTGSRTVGTRVLRDMHIHGEVDFLAAMERSCNVYFWGVAERVGVDRLAHVARELGLGSRTGLGLNGDARGRLPAGSKTDRRETDRLLRTLRAGIGAGEVELTVMQLAMAYAALANGGRLYTPQVVLRLQTRDGEVVEERPPVLRREIDASPATLALIRRGMWRVVNTRGGTAFSARRGAVELAGKTGTARAGTAGPHAWFVGWAPVTSPEIVLAVLVEHGGIGGEVAAPVARAIADGWFERGARRRAVAAPP